MAYIYNFKVRYNKDYMIVVDKGNLYASKFKKYKAG